MNKVRRQLPLVSLIVISIAALWWGLAAFGGDDGTGPWPRVTLTVPAGSNPVVVYDTDSSGLIKLIQTGSNSYSAMNFSGAAILTVIQQGSAGGPIIEVANPVGNPALDVTWHDTAGGTSTVSVPGGSSSSCSTCNRTDIDP